MAEKEIDDKKSGQKMIGEERPKAELGPAKKPSKSAAAPASSVKKPSKSARGWIAAAIAAFLLLLIIGLLSIFVFLPGNRDSTKIIDKQVAAINSLSKGVDLLIVPWHPYYGKGPYDDKDPLRNKSGRLIKADLTISDLQEGMIFSLLGREYEQFSKVIAGHKSYTADARETWSYIDDSLQIAGKARHVIAVGRKSKNAPIQLFDVAKTLPPVRKTGYDSYVFIDADGKETSQEFLFPNGKTQIRE